MEIIAQHSTIFYVLAFGFGLYMCWGIGANDVANAMGTSVGSGAITVKQALILAAIMEFAGAYLAGGAVAATISKGIIDGKLFEPVPHLLMFGMMGALLAAGIWLMVASMRGWPVSTTHSIIGAVCGVGVAALGFDAVQVGQDGRDRRQLVHFAGARAASSRWLLTLSIRKLISTPRIRSPRRASGARCTPSWSAGSSRWSPSPRVSSTSTSPQRHGGSDLSIAAGVAVLAIIAKTDDEPHQARRQMTTAISTMPASRSCSSR
jgi:phosphate/sulfate permease